MSRENQPELLISVDGIEIEVQSDVTWYGSFCQGCGDEPCEDGEDYFDAAGKVAIARGFRYRKDGPNGAGNYCPDCFEEATPS